LKFSANGGKMTVRGFHPGEDGATVHTKHNTAEKGLVAPGLQLNSKRGEFFLSQ
jgi:hypothetical protein